MHSEKPRSLTLVSLLLVGLASLGLSGCDSSSVTALELHPSELVFQVDPRDELPPPRKVKAAFTGSQLLVTFPQDSKPPSWLEIIPDEIKVSEATFHIGLSGPSALPPLPLNTVIRFMTSIEDGSDSRFIDMPITVVEDTLGVPYHLSVSPARLEFTANSGQANPPEAQSMTVTEQQGWSDSCTLAVSYSGERQDWLKLPDSCRIGAPCQVVPNTAALPMGEYEAVVRFIPSLGTDREETRLTVVYKVASPALVASPAEPTLRVDGQTTEAQLSFPLVPSSPGPALDWRVVSTSASWLETSVASGNTQQQPGLDLRVRKDALASLDNGTWSATLTLAYGSADMPERRLEVPVKLVVALPRVRTVMPYATEAGRSLSHILRGEGFSSLPPEARVRIGATEVSAFQVISDKEIRLDAPAQAVGAHAISIDNALGLSRPGAPLHAVQTPAFSEFSFARERSPLRLIYDPLRLAVYAVESDPNNYYFTWLYRYRYVDGAWNREEFIFLPGIRDAVMDVDGQSLYLAVGVGLYRLNLEDPNLTARFVRGIVDYSKLEVLNDGTVLTRNCGRLASSLDGRRAIGTTGLCYSMMTVWIEEPAGEQPPSPQGRYFSTTSDTLAVDRTARYVMIGRNVYDAALTSITDLGADLYAPSFSPDARRLFGLVGVPQQGQVLYVYDVSSSPVSGQFPRLAELVVPDTPDWVGSSAQSLITPDGRTLILADGQRFHVFPLPPSVQ